MYDAAGEVLYVGKAKSLRHRVSSYFRATRQAIRTKTLVARIARVEVTITRTETEALILESSLIKDHQPRYNVLLRDDKSYPYIFLSQEPFPRFAFHRGARTAKGRYFGPFPSAAAVRESLGLLQKLFLVRQCEDSFFRNRSRPCLQYQIRRCTAPCVGSITEEAYAEAVKHAVMFLEGKDNQVIDELIERMEYASQQLSFEEAARYRDQIANLRRVQERQYVMASRGDVDVIAAALEHGAGCIQLFYIRGGRNLGNRSFFPQQLEGVEQATLIASFMSQFYLAGMSRRRDRLVPREILIDGDFPERKLFEQALGEQSGHRVSIVPHARGERARWIELAAANAVQALRAKLRSREHLQQRFEALQEVLGLEAQPQRIECFDISHTMGEETVASCVVFDSNGPLKSDYRRYNVRPTSPGDDYAAMREALLRRFKRLSIEGGKLPDILLIDGGKGQLAQAEEVLAELHIPGVLIIGVAKGKTRKPGLEQLFLSGQAVSLTLPPSSGSLHLIQHVRDEAHRFAITGHRQRRADKRKTSLLESITGLGPKRRQLLLQQFGGLREVARASVEDLTRVRGISQPLAQRVYDLFHAEEGGD